MILKTFLAKCENRKSMPKENVKTGSPDDWFDSSILASLNISGFTFDFFIDWTTNQISNEAWVKLVYSYQNSDNELKENFVKDLEECCSREYFTKMFHFCKNINLDFYFIAFNDTQDWSNDSSYLHKIKLYENDDRLNLHFTQMNISEFKKNIQKLSGGPIRIGTKGLFYGTSNLECYLSRTSSLYPGDADLVLTNNENQPLALIEFKKHTKDTKISDQKISNYYPSPDKRKYDRLNMLKNYIAKQGYNIPFLVLYYPTKIEHTMWKLENIYFNGTSFDVLNYELFNLPQFNDLNSYKKVVETVILKIKDWEQ